MNSKSLKTRITSVFVAIILAITSVVIMPMTAAADNKPPSSLESSTYNVAIWADAENTLTMDDITAFVGGTKTTMVGAVGIFRVTTTGSQYYLFLPSNADCNNLKIWYSTAFKSVKIDGTEIANGEPTNLLADADEGGVAKSHTFSVTPNSGQAKTYNTIVLKSGDVGTVYIDTANGSISSLNVDNHTSSTTGTIMVVNPDGTIEYDGVMEKMSGRGNGTWNKSGVKNPYNVKLAASTSLLGMNKAKKWVLLANAGDATLIKNQLTYDFAKYIGIKYQPVCKPVDLYVNQQYYGSYSLAEKVEIKKKRINVTNAYENLELANGTVDPATGQVVPRDLSTTSAAGYDANGSSVSLTTSSFLSTKSNGHNVGYRAYSSSLTSPTDYTGGYLYELEISKRWTDEKAGFCGYNRQGWVLKSCNVASREMVNYSYDLLFALGSSVYNNGVVPSTATTTTCNNGNSNVKTTNNPAPAEKYRGKKWSEILDADSAVRYYWTQEYFKNMDSATSSTYFYKDSDSIDPMLYAGPMWDMDNSLGFDASGSRWNYSWTSATGWYTRNARIYRFYAEDSTTSYSSNDQAPLNFYAALATNCSDFWTQAKSYWHNLIYPATQILLGNAVDSKGVLRSTDYYVNTVAKSALMNNYRIKGTTSYDAQGIISGINTWIGNRNTWINNEISTTSIANVTIQSIPDQPCTGSPITPELVVTDNGARLVEGVDYTVSFVNNVNVSSVAKATITGKGYYTGQKSIYFNIVKGSIASVQINSAAYEGDTLKSKVLTGTDDALTSFCTYQWKADDVAIPNATEANYVVESGMAGKTITVTVTGDGTNFYSTPVTSSGCSIHAGERPEGFAKTLASWDYDYTLNPDALTNGDTTGATYFYNATSGENAEGAKLIASVNADDIAKIKWSGATDLYVNSRTSLGEDRAPVMGTSKTDLLGWGYYPYFETTVDATNYEAIKFSAKLGGSKRGPSDWNLQYSVDGVNYVDIPNTNYTITENKVLEDAFVDVLLPTDCNDVENLHIRMTVNEDIAINGVNTIVNQLSGDAAINNIAIKGSSMEVVTDLAAPEFSTTSIIGDGKTIFDTENVVITDTNGGADIYYQIGDGDATLYQGEFNPFAKTAAKGDTATITAWAGFEDIESDHVTFTVTNAGTSIGEFNFDDYSQNVSNGAVFSTGGAYGESTKMTAYTDGVSQYVPCWNASNGAFSLSPDDGAKWSASSGFYFEVSTAGYSDICFTTKAYTTGRGPKSVKLQYSTDNGTSWADATGNTALTMNGQLEQLYMTAALPAACSNKAKLLIRVATVENLNALGEVLHNNESKGNLYINNIIISGDDDGSLKMPYTNKTTAYFGDKTIKYKSADKEPMTYTVLDANSNVIMSGRYNSTDGINISAWEGFNPKTAGPYTVSVWEGDDDEKSLVNTKQYYYKGETVVKFNYNDTTRPIASYINEDSTVLTNTSGVNAGTLSMYPNGSSITTLGYSNAYGVKASWESDNKFNATKNLDNPSGNGYWLIKTSTLGYTSTSLNLEQISSNKGPRDWGIAYSTDGVSYTYVANSNVRAISNDTTTEPIETYNNLPLPAACDNQEELYIKVFINGGESIDGSELETLLKGNTGINNIEISGIAEPEQFTITFKTVAYEDMDRTVGTTPIESHIFVNGLEYETTNGEASVTLTEGDAYTYYASAAGTTFESDRMRGFVRADAEVVIPIVALDATGDGFINAKDFAKIRRESEYAANRAYLLDMYPSFHNVSELDFTSHSPSAPQE